MRWWLRYLTGALKPSPLVFLSYFLRILTPAGVHGVISESPRVPESGSMYGRVGVCIGLSWFVFSLGLVNKK